LSRKCPHCGHVSPAQNGALSRAERGRLTTGAVMGSRGAANKLIADYHRHKGGGGGS
jgi:hypothetical protein